MEGLTIESSMTDNVREILAETADFLHKSCSHIASLEQQVSQLEEEKTALAKKAAKPDRDIELLKVASLNEETLAPLVDNLVKLAFIREDARDAVLQQYKKNPNELVDLVQSLVAPMVSDADPAPGRAISKQASQVAADEQSDTEILRTIKVERS